MINHFDWQPYVSGWLFVKKVTNDDKTPEYDGELIIKENVWISTNFTLLYSIMIGRGAFIPMEQLVEILYSHTQLS